jgi:hypothetical protein
VEKFKFDLQLFNDSGDTGATNPDPGKEMVGLDDQGNVKMFYDNQGEEDDNLDESGQEEPETKDNKPPESEQTYYTPDDVRSTDFEKLDPSKIPPEMVPWYKSMQAGFTRKTQELANEKKVIHEFANELAERLKQQPAEQPKQMDAKTFYAQQHAFLRGEVASMFGVDSVLLPDSLNEWPPEMQLAYTDKRAQMQEESKRRQEAHNEEQQRLQQEQEAIKAFTTYSNEIERDLRGIDNDAYLFAIGKLKNGEVLEKDKDAIKKALVKGDRDTVMKHFEGFRQEYHAQKAGIKTGEKAKDKPTPAKLESSGAGKQVETKAKPDYSELGKLQSFDEKLAWMRKHNITP